jgi:hypothetical protein
VLTEHKEEGRDPRYSKFLIDGNEVGMKRGSSSTLVLVLIDDPGLVVKPPADTSEVVDSRWVDIDELVEYEDCLWMILDHKVMVQEVKEALSTKLEQLKPFQNTKVE